ncbi:MAG: hypothetical protein AAF250_00490 [Pseudomonadota bacterium]
MVEFIPFMLFILGWHPDRPGEIDLQRTEILFASEKECAETGSAMAERMTEVAASQSGARYQFQCMAIPAREEFDTLYEREFGNEQ